VKPPNKNLKAIICWRLRIKKNVKQPVQKKLSLSDKKVNIPY
jgi:hypothetical protein